MTSLQVPPDLSNDRIVFMERLCHDMRSLLASILGYATLVAEPDLHPPEANLGPYGQVIVKQTLRLQRMVEDAVTITHITENRLDLALTPIQLSPLISAVACEAREQSGRNISYCDDERTWIVRADPLRLGEVITKVIDNAIKFSQPGAPIEIDITNDDAKKWVEIRVEDHGIGIAEADIARLFRPFGRIYNDQTRTIPGNGLGLYIVREIVAAHQGEVTLQSQIGMGSVFTISLPSIGGAG
jgi:signal transduction histidine kinase